MRSSLFALSVCAMAFAAGGLPAAEPTLLPNAVTERDALFRKPQVLNLRIVVAKADVESLGREPRKYVRCILKEGNAEYVDIGIHLRGAAGSFRGFDDKPGLTLNADRFVDAQRFHGLDKFHLANSVQDPSYLSELICGELFRTAGVPAARVSHAIVTLNERRHGLYYLKEGYDKQFLRTNLGSSNGNFYDGGFLREIDQPLERISGNGDVADRADLKALLAAVRERDERQRFAKLEQLLDMDRFISYVVCEMITSDWDGYPSKCNNYRIYHDPKMNKITFIPSGMDQMFGDTNWPIYPEWGGAVARELMSTKDGKRRYTARLREIMAKVYSVERLTRRLDEVAAVVQPALASVNPGAGRDYNHHVNRLREAIKQRAVNINKQLERLPPEK